MNKELNRQIAPEYHQITKINIPTDECGFLANKMPYHVLSGGSQEIVVVELMFNAGVIHSNQLLVASTANTMLVSFSGKLPMNSSILLPVGVNSLIGTSLTTVSVTDTYASPVALSLIVFSEDMTSFPSVDDSFLNE